ncbi:hypothetical protein U1Q18_004773 [Sarracenia purpurea var. burkii]
MASPIRSSYRLWVFGSWLLLATFHRTGPGLLATNGLDRDVEHWLDPDQISARCRRKMRWSAPVVVQQRGHVLGGAVAREGDARRCYGGGPDGVQAPFDLCKTQILKRNFFPAPGRFHWGLSGFICP